MFIVEEDVALEDDIAVEEDIAEFVDIAVSGVGGGFEEREGVCCEIRSER